MVVSRFFFSLALASFMGGSTALAAPSSGKMSFFACHKSFKDAKQNGTLNGQDYAAFKASHCSGETGTTSSSTTTPSSSSVEKPAAKPVLSSNATFPTRIDPEFSSLSAGKARQKTCLKQYHANKTNNSNGDLKWIQKGGGYYSQCNSRLKETSAQ